MNFKEMKLKSIFLTAVAAVVISCGGPSDRTVLKGELGAIDQIQVLIPSVGIDTTVLVHDGEFEVELPVVLTDIARVEMNGNVATFIADGTTLTVENGEIPIVVSSARKSANNALYDYIAGEEKLLMDYNDSLDGCVGDEVRQLALRERYVERYIQFNFDSFHANKDNIMSVVALQNLRGAEIDDAQLDEMISSLSHELQLSEYVVVLKNTLQARMATAEGKHFADCLIHHVESYDKEGQPVYKEVKLSDYLGKGKYTLVDFWAPWCAPCKAEVPGIRQVYEKYKDRGFDVLSVAVWEQKPQSHTIETAEDLGMNWNHINNAGAEVADLYGLDGIPHLILVSPDGIILKRGFHGLEEIEAVVTEYIK